MSGNGVVLDAAGITKTFGRGTEKISAVERVDLTLHRGETLGLVGESGCGKSTLARLVTRLIDADSGRVVFEGHDITRMRGRSLRRARARMQIVFQDPRSSLNPRRDVGGLVAEPLIEHRLAAPSVRREQVEDLLQRVGLDSRFMSRYPGELSGGQAQRVAIARALAVEPTVLIADEATSALDVSVAAQILNLLSDLKESLGIAYLLISHDLDIVRHLSDRIAVMYLGRIVETAPADRLFVEPLHPYTAALLSASLTMRPESEHRIVLRGDPSNAAETGCPFRSRCPIGPLVDPTKQRCIDELPALTGTDGHMAACHFPGELRTARSTTNSHPQIAVSVLTEASRPASPQTQEKWRRQP